MISGGKYIHYPRTDPKAFNELCEDAGMPFRWEDKERSWYSGAFDAVRTNVPGWIEDDEIVFDNESAKSFFTNDDGKLNKKFWNTVTAVGKPAFTSLIYQIITDRGINGNKWNDDTKRDCTLFPPQDPKDIELCEFIAEQSMDCDNSRGGKLYKCGDLHGVSQQFPKLDETGYDSVWISPTNRPSRNIGINGDGIYDWASYHGYHPLDIGFKYIAPQLRDPNVTDQELMRGFYREAWEKYEMKIMNDTPLVCAQTFEYADAQIVVESPKIYYDGNMVADILEEAKNDDVVLGSDMPLDKMMNPKNFYTFGANINGDPKQYNIWDQRYQDYLSSHAYQSTNRPNLIKDGKACELYLKRLDEMPIPEGIRQDLRLDAIYYFSDKTCLKDYAKKYRNKIRGPELVVGEWYGALEHYDNNHTSILKYMLEEDLEKRMDIFFFGAKTALQRAFMNDHGTLGQLKDIINVYERYNFSPEVTSHLDIFVDNHDDPLMADIYTKDGKKLIRATHDDIINAHLARAFTPAPVVDYYATQEFEHDKVGGLDFMGRRSFDPYNRPIINPDLSIQKSDWNDIQRASYELDKFREEHFRSIGFGSFEEGFAGKMGNDFFADDKSFAVKRKRADDEIMVMVLRGENGKSVSRKLTNYRTTLSDGKWKDTLTGIKFESVDGYLKPIAGKYYDKIHNRDLTVEQNGNIDYSLQASYDASTKAVFNIEENNTAMLPDGYYRPVNPIVSDPLLNNENGERSCDPRSAYDKRQNKDPYDNCAWLGVENGNVVMPKKPDHSFNNVMFDHWDKTIGVRKMDDGSIGLPDGQYFFENGLGTDQVLYVKDNRVVMMPNTRVLYLEKTDFVPMTAEDEIAEVKKELENK